MKTIEIGTKLADSVGFNEERFGHNTILTKNGNTMILGSFRSPKSPTAIDELCRACIKEGYDFCDDKFGKIAIY